MGCGLAEIQYPHTWYNVTEEDVWFFLSENDTTSRIPSTKLSSGYYNDPVTLMYHVNNGLYNIWTDKARAQMSYSPVTHKMTLHMTSNSVFTIPYHSATGPMLGLGSLFGGLLPSAMPLIKRGAVALGRGVLKTGVRIAGEVLSGQNIKRAAKRRVTDAGKTMPRGLVIHGVRPRKRVKRAPTKKGGTTAKRQRKRRTSKKREADIFDNDDDFRT